MLSSFLLGNAKIKCALKYLLHVYNIWYRTYNPRPQKRPLPRSQTTNSEPQTLLRDGFGSWFPSPPFAGWPNHQQLGLWWYLSFSPAKGTFSRDCDLCFCSKCFFRHMHDVLNAFWFLLRADRQRKQKCLSHVAGHTGTNYHCPE